MSDGRYLLRVRGLKTNFYTYQGVVKALDNIDMEVRLGETLGIVGETGCGKSVTALSVLRLIPSPPGKVEAGEALVDIREDEVEELDALRAELRGHMKEIFGGKGDYSKAPVTYATVGSMLRTLERKKSTGSSSADLQKKLRALGEKLKAHDLLAMDVKGLQEIRGNTISMIFQEPMQALNPVFTVGDQISESIVLHRRRWLARRIVLRMRAETLKDHVVGDLRPFFPHGAGLPQGVDLVSPTVTDLEMLRENLEKRPGDHRRLLRDIEELIGYGRLLGPETAESSIFARSLPRGVQVRLYESESLTSAWKATDLLQELNDLGSVASGQADGGALWADVRITGPFVVAVDPLPGSTAQALVERLDKISKGKDAPLSFWAALGRVVEPPKVEGGRVLLAVRKELRRDRLSVVSKGLGRVPFLKRAVLRPLRAQALEEAAEVLRLLKISDPRRVVNMFPHELSGGMNQRAMIAIALACDPLLLIADEPTTALDVTIQAQILELLRDLKSRGRPSLILITHDLGVIAEMSDRVAVMYGGNIVETATTREIFRNPLHPYTRGLLKAIPSQTVSRDRLEVIKGSVPNLIYPPSGCRFHPRCPVALPHCGWDAKDLEGAIQGHQKELGIPEGAIASIAQADLFTLRVTFAEGQPGDAAMAAIRQAVAQEKTDRAMYQAIREIRQDGRDLVFTMMKSVKPRDLEVSPGHVVACYLYDEARVPQAVPLEVA